MVLLIALNHDKIPQKGEPNYLVRGNLTKVIMCRKNFAHLPGFPINEYDYADLIP